jgi:hypothetical protein
VSGCLRMLGPSSVFRSPAFSALPEGAQGNCSFCQPLASPVLLLPGFRLLPVPLVFRVCLPPPLALRLVYGLVGLGYPVALSMIKFSYRW